MARLKNETNIVFEATIRIRLPVNYGRTSPEDTKDFIAGARDVNDHIREAVGNWGGQFYPDHPFFNVDVLTCNTRKIGSDQEPKKIVEQKRAASSARRNNQRVTKAIKSIKEAPAKSKASAKAKSSIPLAGWSEAVKRNRKKLQQLSD